MTETHAKQEMAKVTVKLTFTTEEQRKWFVGQLTDGFGENECDIKWKGKVDATSADELFVDVSHNEAFQHDQKMKKKYGR